ncbi:hypothetical protein KR026_009769, partial [Drosophila bipectinata]
NHLLLHLFITDKFDYVISQKGRVLLRHGHFYYLREKCINDKTYWRCTQYTTQAKCHGRVHTLHGKIVHSSRHNHNPLTKKRKNVVEIVK